MSTVYLCSDFHLGHRNIGVHRKTCESEEENYEYLKERWHKLVTKRDTVICLGDMCFSEERLKDFSTWRAERKILVCGNHDKDKIKMSTIVQYYDDVHSLLRYKGMWLSHAPIHPSELRGRLNVHGHCHYAEVGDPRYLNVCPEHTDGYPVNFELVKKIFIERGVLKE